MDLYEYQAKELFAKHGVPTQSGEVVRSPKHAQEAAERIGGAHVCERRASVVVEKRLLCRPPRERPIDAVDGAVRAFTPDTVVEIEAAFLQDIDLNAFEHRDAFELRVG